jgi:hypothetical protein
MTETERGSERMFPALYSLAFLLAAALSFVMLATDKNLQTDFGTISSGYFVHWYVVLATGVADLVGAALLLVLRNRSAVKLGVVGSALLTLMFVGVIATYSQVGFASASDFAQYLFGLTYFGGDIRYLYDVLLATYIGTFVAGVVGLALTRESRAPSPKGVANPGTSS